MGPAELIARATAKTSDMDSVGVSSVAGLQADDAARAMAGLERGPYLLAMVMWAGDASCLYPLQTHLWGEIGLVAQREKWKLVAGKQFLRWLACMAIDEFVEPKKCPACSGRSVVQSNSGVVSDCRVCNGTGNGKVSGRERARLVDMPETSWRRVWAPRYEREGIARLRGWETVAGVHISKKMRVWIDVSDVFSSGQGELFSKSA